jgi:hypothetical protein
MRQQRFKVSRDPVVKKTAQDNYTAWKEGPYGKVRRKLSRLWQCPCSLTNTEQLHIAWRVWDYKLAAQLLQGSAPECWIVQL